MLKLAATPIGNLEDITLRALEALRAADVIYAEDTRRTLQLLNHFGIKKPLVSCRAQNEAARAAELVPLLEAGREVVYVSDAACRHLRPRRGARARVRGARPAVHGAARRLRRAHGGGALRAGRARRFHFSASCRATAAPGATRSPPSARAAIWRCCMKARAASRRRLPSWPPPWASGRPRCCGS